MDVILFYKFFVETVFSVYLLSDKYSQIFRTPIRGGIEDNIQIIFHVSQLML